jgi:hypothetical protein
MGPLDLRADRQLRRQLKTDQRAEPGQISVAVDTSQASLPRKVCLYAVGVVCSIKLN